MPHFHDLDYPILSPLSAHVFKHMRQQAEAQQHSRILVLVPSSRRQTKALSLLTNESMDNRAFPHTTINHSYHATPFTIDDADPLHPAYRLTWHDHQHHKHEVEIIIVHEQLQESDYRILLSYAVVVDWTNICRFGRLDQRALYLIDIASQNLDIKLNRRREQAQ